MRKLTRRSEAAKNTVLTFSAFSLSRCGCFCMCQVNCLSKDDAAADTSQWRASANTTSGSRGFSGVIRQDFK